MIIYIKEFSSPKEGEFEPVERERTKERNGVRRQ